MSRPVENVVKHGMHPSYSSPALVTLGHNQPPMQMTMASHSNLTNPTTSVSKIPSQNSNSEDNNSLSKKLLKDWGILSEDLNEAVVGIQRLTAERPLPEKFRGQEISVEHKEMSHADKLLQGTIENMQQFYEWFEELGEEDVEEAKYSDRIETLKAYRDYCDMILKEIEETANFLQELEDKYNLVAKKTGELHQACELLVQEQNKLVSFADNLEQKLTYFNELPKIAAKFNSPTITVYDPTFRSVLGKLDECIEFVTKHRDFKDSENYVMKYRQLQNRGLSMLKNEIIQTLRNATTQIIQQMKSAPDTQSAETQAYVKFRTVAPKVKPLCEEIEKRASKIREYALLLEDCQKCYFQQRSTILSGVINLNITTLCKETNELTNLTRTGCLYLVGICQNEFQLYQHFFVTPSTGLAYYLSSPSSPNLFSGLLESFSTILYDSFRPLYIRSRNIEMLCQVVYLLKTEISVEQLEQRGDSVVPFKAIVKRMIQDVQERLTFLAQTYIRDEIAAYVPSNEDLDYPKKLGAVNVDMSVSSSLSNQDNNILIPFRSLYRTWYPTLEKTLVCLSKLYLTVDTRIFEGLATEAINACTATLIEAAHRISKKSAIDGQLFLIKHFFTLKEQITPFEVNFSFMEQILDFSHMTGVLRRAISGPYMLFTVPFYASLPPTIEVQQVDSKKTLEKELKQGLENFIMNTTKLTIDQLISFLTKANAFLNVAIQKKQEPGSLRTQAFATPEKINELFDETKKGIEQNLGSILEKTKAYITNPLAQAILFKPIREQIVDSLEQLQRLIATYYTEDDKKVLNMSKVEEIYAQLDFKSVDSVKKASE